MHGYILSRLVIPIPHWENPALKRTLWGTLPMWSLALRCASAAADWSSNSPVIRMVSGHLPLFVRIPSSSISPDAWGWKVAELGKRVGELVRARSLRTYGLGVHKCMYVLLLTHLHFNDFMIHSALSRRTASPRTNGPQIDIWSGRRCKWGMGLPKWPWIWNTVINHEIFGD